MPQRAREENLDGLGSHQLNSWKEFYGTLPLVLLRKVLVRSFARASSARAARTVHTVHLQDFVPLCNLTGSRESDEL